MMKVFNQRTFNPHYHSWGSLASEIALISRNVASNLTMRLFHQWDKTHEIALALDCLTNEKVLLHIHPKPIGCLNNLKFCLNYSWIILDKHLHLDCLNIEEAIQPKTLTVYCRQNYILVCLKILAGPRLNHKTVYGLVSVPPRFWGLKLPYSNLQYTKILRP